MKAQIKIEINLSNTDIYNIIESFLTKHNILVETFNHDLVEVLSLEIYQKVKNKIIEKLKQE